MTTKKSRRSSRKAGKKPASKAGSLIKKFKALAAKNGYGSPGIFVTQQLYKEYKKLPPEQQKEVRQGLLKAGIKLLALI